MAVRDFLRSLSYRGAPLGAAGGPVDVTSGSYLERSFPLVFANILRIASQPGGFLSSLGSDRVFSGEADALVLANRRRKEEGGRALQQSGLNPAMATRLLEEQDIEQNLQLSQLRGRSERELQERDFGAQSELAKVLASAEIQEKVAKQEEENQRKLRKILKKGQKLQKIGLGVSLLQALGSFVPVLGAVTNIGATAAKTAVPGLSGSKGLDPAFFAGGQGSQSAMDAALGFQPDFFSGGGAPFQSSFGQSGPPAFFGGGNVGRSANPFSFAPPLSTGTSGGGSAAEFLKFLSAQ